MALTKTPTTIFNGRWLLFLLAFSVLPACDTNFLGPPDENGEKDYGLPDPPPYKPPIVVGTYPMYLFEDPHDVSPHQHSSYTLVGTALLVTDYDSAATTGSIGGLISLWGRDIVLVGKHIWYMDTYGWREPITLANKDSTVRLSVDLWNTSTQESIRATGMLYLFDYSVADTALRSLHVDIATPTSLGLGDTTSYLDVSHIVGAHAAYFQDTSTQNLTSVGTFMVSPHGTKEFNGILSINGKQYNVGGAVIWNAIVFSDYAANGDFVSVRFEGGVWLDPKNPSTAYFRGRVIFYDTEHPFRIPISEKILWFK